MNIPFMDLKASLREISDEINAKICELINSTRFIGGEEIELFEKEYSTFCDTQYAVGCSNGTDALILALKALGIGEGDTVVTVPNTFIATTEAISAVGAKVDFVDIEEDFYSIDPIKLLDYLKHNKTKKNVKAVIPVHLYGQMANMPKIMEVAKQYDIKVIEDAAQAHGAKINDKKPGFYGNVATFSFYPGKNLGAFGDAGAVVTNNENVYKKIKMLVNHGRWKEKYTHRIEGYNKRIDTIQAGILRIKLKHLNDWNNLRREKAKIYDSLLDAKKIFIPRVRDNFIHVYHLYVIRIKKRDTIKKKLKEIGINTGIHYPIPLHLQPAYKKFEFKRGDFPISEKVMKEILSLPIWPEITENQIKKVVEAINESR